MLEKLRIKLLDLTLMNRLLNFKEKSARVVRVVDELPDQLYTRLLEGKEFEFVPVALPSKDHPLSTAARDKKTSAASAVTYARELGIETSYELPTGSYKDGPDKHQDDKIQTLLFPAAFEKSLAAVASEARAAIEEKGSNVLYMIFGFLEWAESESSERKLLAPLVLLPVTVTKGAPDKSTGAYRFHVAYSQDDVLPNISLQEKLKRDFRMALPDLDDGETPDAYFERLQREMELPPGWRVSRQVALGLVSFSKLFMYRDLDPASWPSGAGPGDHRCVKELLGAGEGSAESGTHGENGEYDFEGHGFGPTPPIVPPIVMDADSSQHSAIVDACNGRDLVIEGPPGTGKSQTIANLIAATMADGKSVLFVAEKLTALEVVRKRLDDVGLGVFCLELHSDKTQKNALHDDIEKRLEISRSLASLDELEGRKRLVDDLRSKLNSYSKVMNQRVGSLGWTVHDVLWGIQRRRSELGSEAAEAWKNVVIEGANEVSLKEREELVRSARTFASALKELRKRGDVAAHPFFGCWFRSPEPSHEDRIRRYLETVQATARDAGARMAELAQITGQPMREFAADLAHIAARARTLEPLAEGACTEGAIHLPGDEPRAELLAWVEEIDAWRREEQFIGTRVPEVDARRLLQQLSTSDTNRVAGDLSLDEVTGALNVARDVRTFLKSAETVLGKIRGILDDPKLPSSFAAVEMAHALAACAKRAPRDALGHRSREDGTAVVERASQTAAELRSERAALGELFDLDVLPESDVLERSAATCAAAGFFAFFSSEFRAARTRLAGVSRLPAKRTNAQMAEAFRSLASYRRRRAEYETNPELKAVFGLCFAGIDTDFDAVRRADAWMGEVRALQRRCRHVSSKIGAVAKAPVDLLDDLADLHELTSVEGASGVLASARRLITATHRDVDVDGATFAEIEGLIAQSLSVLEPLQLLAVRVPRAAATSVGELGRLALALRELDARKTNLESSRLARAALGGRFNGVSTARTGVEATVAYSRALYADETPTALRAFLLRSGDRSSFVQVVSASERAAHAVSRMWEAEASFVKEGEVVVEDWYMEAAATRKSAEVMKRAERALAHIEELPGWGRYLRARAAYDAVGGQTMRERAELDPRLDLDSLPSATEYVLMNTLAGELFRDEPELATHDGRQHAIVRQQFGEHDKDVVRLERERIAARLKTRPVPEGVRSPRVKELTELHLLRHELGKQRKHIPIRQLINRAGGALQALKPCFMMSPRSVAQYLEAGRHSFDLIVMDEASQLRPEDAMGAIARGRQLIVVGDSKQLPPTSFFASEEDDDADREEDEDGDSVADGKESILDLARTVSRSVRSLRWHYRSRHGSLIAFSNDRYYDKKLVVFPSAQHANDELGVNHVMVDGATYADGKNLNEAKAVVDAVLEHLRHRSHESLGIVALNIRQKTLIEELLSDRLKDEPVLRERFDRGGSNDGGFVKNLESVQGDERDVIFISVTYGPATPGGKVARRFGPINGANGWRRLNVLFTRAKRRVTVFSSFTAEQLEEHGLSRGGADLRAYLAFARTGQYQEAHHTGREPDSDFEVEVANTLREQGYEVTPQVGVAGYFIDLGVRAKHGGRFLLGVECDGARYHSSFSARDRDRLRQQVLEGLGWEIFRIWSTDWYRDGRKQRQRLLEAVKKAEGRLS